MMLMQVWSFGGISSGLINQLLKSVALRLCCNSPNRFFQTIPVASC